MDTKLKQRLIGAAVLVALAVIFVPFFLNGSGIRQDEAGQIPAAPEPPEPLDTSVEPLATEDRAALENSPPRVVSEAPESEPEERAAPAKDEAADPAIDASEPADEGSWLVQLGSFGEKANALKLQERVRGYGLAAFVEQVEVSGEPVYRVRVGPWLRESDAEGVREQLAEEHGLDALVLQRD